MLLKVENICKRFPGVIALDGVDFEVSSGEIHILLGENGAGKSTLMKVLSGVYTPDEGRMELRGQEYAPRTPKDAMNRGVGIIHQELQLVPDLSIAENIFLGDEHTTRTGKLDKRRMESEASEMLRALGMDVDVTDRIRDCGIAAQQMVEIAKTLRKKVDLLIMDEPTAALSSREVDQLFAAIRRLKASGVGIIYISHRLEEIQEIGDRITILRDGKTIRTLEVGASTVAEWVRYMVGRELHEPYPKAERSRGEEVLRVRGLTSKGRFEDITFALYEGEILSIAGLVGSGRTEILRAIFGVDPIDSGEIIVRGKPVRISSPKDAVELGIGFLPEDRKSQGLVLAHSVLQNTTIATLGEMSGRVFLNRQLMVRTAERYKAKLNIKTPTVYQTAGSLSGGNQQKIVLSKWLVAGSKILMIDEPTRGVDVGAKSEIYKHIAALVEQGWAVLMVSSELPEVLGVSDRILVLRDGRVQAELTRESASQELITKFAMGGTRVD